MLDQKDSSKQPSPDSTINYLLYVGRKDSSKPHSPQKKKILNKIQSKNFKYTQFLLPNISAKNYVYF
jgi:hypothetical protein